MGQMLRCFAKLLSFGCPNKTTSNEKIYQTFMFGGRTNTQATLIARVNHSASINEILF